MEYQLRSEAERLLPRLKEVKDQEPQRWQLAAKSDVLGTSQAFQLGSRSQTELVLLY
jgi:hypothetical protein